MLAKIPSATKTEEQKKKPRLQWSKFKSGDGDGLAALFRVFYSRLFHYGYKIVSNEDVIEDAIQKLFLRLWEKRASISEAESVQAYLFSSLRRIIFRKLEKTTNRTRRNHRYKKDMLEEPGNIEKLIIQFEFTHQRKNKLTRALQSLSQRQKRGDLLEVL